MDYEKALSEERKKIREGLRENGKKLITHKRRMGHSLVIMQNGRIVEIAPEDLPGPENLDTFSKGQIPEKPE